MYFCDLLIAMLGFQGDARARGHEIISLDIIWDLPPSLQLLEQNDDFHISPDRHKNNILLTPGHKI